MRNTNATFSSKLGSLPGGTNVIMALGFSHIPESDEWILAPTEHAWNNLVGCQVKLQAFDTKLTQHLTSGATTSDSPLTSSPATATSNHGTDHSNVLSLMAMLQQMVMSRGGGESGSVRNSSNGRGDANSDESGSGDGPQSSEADSNEKA